MSSAESKLAMAKTVISTLGSMAATAMVVRTIVHDYLPPEFQDYLSLGLRNFFSLFSNQLTMVIDEFDGLVANEIYEAAEAYLGPKTSPKTRRLKVTKPEKERSISVAVERNQEFTDEFGGATFKWVLICRRIESKNFYNPRDIKSSLCAEVRSFELTLHKKHREMVIGSYLPHVVEQAKLNRQSTKTIKIFTADYENMYDMWRSVSLDHPATIGTLAMDPEVKNAVIMDLDRFVKRREYYRKVGKAWKRGYLLYGPPGTGKSSLIAAMANYLNFDIYDLELTEVRRNSDLRRLLVATANRSILVVEDIDCTIDLQDRSAATSEWHPRALRRMGMQSEENKVTLSGFLNFIDGLWSSCGDERIIIFTTNHKDKLDPALLRPGRMDVHIHMSYCTPSGFKLLASNYLGIEDHLLFGEIEELVRMTNVTPAEVAEQLMKNDDIEVALGSLIDFLHGKKKRENEEKDEKLEVEFMGKREESEEITEQVDKTIAQRS